MSDVPPALTGKKEATTATNIELGLSLYNTMQVHKPQVGLWVYRDLPDCPCCLGYWICAVCARSGFDFRGLFCRVGVPVDPTLSKLVEGDIHAIARIGLGGAGATPSAYVVTDGLEDEIEEINRMEPVDSTRLSELGKYHCDTKEDKRLVGVLWLLL